jgi:hypothetical protein
MLPLSADDIRASFVNASTRERAAITPPHPTDLEWSPLEFIGWREPKTPLAAFVVVPLAEGPVGIMLRQAEARTRARPQCSWCDDTTLQNDVTFFAARMAGAAGRKGDSVGTLVCAHFECNTNVRRQQPIAYVGFDVEAARQQRIAALRDHVQSFARRVLGEA